MNVRCGSIFHDATHYIIGCIILGDLFSTQHCNLTQVDRIYKSKVRFLLELGEWELMQEGSAFPL